MGSAYAMGEVESSDIDNSGESSPEGESPNYQSPSFTADMMSDKHSGKNSGKLNMIKKGDINNDSFGMPNGLVKS